MSELDLEAIKARADAATPGPWRSDIGARELGGIPELVILQTGDRGAGERVITTEITSQADATFIAHARTDIPALLAQYDEDKAEIERLWAERDALQAKLDKVRAWASDNDIEMTTFSGNIIHSTSSLLAILDSTEGDTK